MKVERAARHIAHNAVRLFIVPGRCPISIAAAAIYMASQVSIYIYIYIFFFGSNNFESEFKTKIERFDRGAHLQVLTCNPISFLLLRLFYLRMCIIIYI